MAQETKKSLVDEVLDDALQVRETALANAKLALEEAFEPRIKSMISKHLSEMDDEDMDEERDEMDEERDEVDEERDEDMDETYEGDEDMDETLEDPTNADDATIGEEEEEMDEELDSSDIGSSDNAEPSDDASDTSDTLSEEDEEEVEEGEHSDDMEEDLDLESVIAELEAELDDEEGDEELDIDVDSDEEEADMEDEDEDDEIIDLEELLSALSEDDIEEGDVVEEAEEEEMDELAQENAKLASELAEHREAVEILRSKLNEVNLLNAKLLYTTKLFRKYNLNNSQKMKVVESFDRTNSVRETKLVYSTLAESLGISTQKTSNKRASITEGFASKPTTSTKPKQEIISESNEMADRFKRLISYNK